MRPAAMRLSHSPEEIAYALKHPEEYPPPESELEFLQSFIEQDFYFCCVSEPLGRFYCSEFGRVTTKVYKPKKTRKTRKNGTSSDIRGHHSCSPQFWHQNGSCGRQWKKGPTTLRYLLLDSQPEISWPSDLATTLFSVARSDLHRRIVHDRDNPLLIFDEFYITDELRKAAALKREAAKRETKRKAGSLDASPGGSGPTTPTAGPPKLPRIETADSLPSSPPPSHAFHAYIRSGDCGSAGGTGRELSAKSFADEEKNKGS